MNPVRQIYLEIHKAAKDASKPHIFQSNQATGTGKTYQALMTSVQALRDAQKAGESLIVVYVAPQHSHIDINNHPSLQKSESPQALLHEALAIPTVKVESRSLLTNPDEAHNLYHDTQHYEALLAKKSSGKQKPSLIRRLQQILFDYQDEQSTPLPEDSLDFAMAEIKQQQGKLEGLRRASYSETDLKQSVDNLKKAHETLFKRMSRAVEIVLKQTTRPGISLVAMLGHSALVEPFCFFQRQLFPWYEVVRHSSGPLGLVAMTASRLMTQHAFPVDSPSNRKSGRGDFTKTSCYLEDAVHGLMGSSSKIHGLQEGRTRFLFMVDESDAVKGILDEPASSGAASRRMSLRGMLLNQARATQIGRVLLDEMPLVFGRADYLSQVLEDYEGLFEAYPELARLCDIRKPADLEKLPPLSAEAKAALRPHLRRYRLGSMDTSHHMQQVRLRERVLSLLDRQYVDHPEICGSREEKLEHFRQRLVAFCQGVSWVNLNLDDPTVAAAGSTGAFTAGNWSFININDKRMEGLLTHRDVVDVNDVQIISEDFLVASGGAIQTTTFSLGDAFEIMLTIAGIVHEMVNAADGDAFAILSYPYRGNNRTSSAPLTDMIRGLQNIRVKDLMAVRRHVSSQAEIDDDLAFRSPHLVMQWVPDFEYRFLPGEPGVSVVPAIGYRAWSAEHHLERLISPQAYRINSPTIVSDGDETTDAGGGGRPAHSLVLISATGGLEATHIGGFIGDMLAHSPHVTYRPMSEHALSLAKAARDLRHHGNGSSPGRPLPVIAMLPEHQGVLSEEATGPLLSATDDILEELTYNTHKRKESRRVIDLLTLLGKSPARLKDQHAVSSEVYAAVREILDEKAPPRMALMLIQSLKTPVALLRRLVGSRLEEIIEGHLYGYWEGQKGRGGRPVLVIAYRSGREDNTDGRIGQMLRGEGTFGAQRRIFARFLKSAGLLVDLDQCLPAVTSEEVPKAYDATDLLRRDLGCHVAVITTFQSAGLGLNFKVDTHLDSPRDVDLLVLGMSPHFTRARPKFERYQGPPSENEPAETDEARDERARKNQEAFKKNNQIVHGFAMTGMELAARLNQGRWGSEASWPLRTYRAENIRLHPDSYLPAFRDFLQEQHVIDLARTVFQAVGRGERTGCAQRQTLLVCSEIISDLLAADPILYGHDGHGRSRASQLHCASLNSFALMQYVRRHRQSVYVYPSASELREVEKRLFRTHEMFTEDREVLGWKNRQLFAISRMNRGQLTTEEAAALIRTWEAWRDPALLFEATREAYREHALEVGVPEEVLDLMWWPLPTNRFLPVCRDDDGAWAVSLVPADNSEAAQAAPYPREALESSYRLPAGMFELMKSKGIAQMEWEAPSLRWASQGKVLHPILQPDFKGIWGELALDGWLAEVFRHTSELNGLELLPGEATIGIYELFDRYFRWVTPGGKSVLVALDAKHYARSTDRRRGVSLLSDPQGKQSTVREWAKAKGYQRVVMAYINTQPCPQEEARSGILSGDVMSLNAFVRVSPTDVNAPKGEYFGYENTADKSRVESPLLAANQAGVARWIKTVMGGGQ